MLYDVLRNKWGVDYADLTGSKPNIPSDAVLLYTGIPVAPKAENQNLKVVAAWGLNGWSNCTTADLQVGYLTEWTEADIDVTAIGEKAILQDKDVVLDTITQEEYDAKVQELGEKQVKRNKARGAVPGKCKGEKNDKCHYLFSVSHDK